MDDLYWQNGWAATPLGDVAFWFNRMLQLCQWNKINHYWFQRLDLLMPLQLWQLKKQCIPGKKTLLYQDWFCFTDLFEVNEIIFHSIWLPCVCNTLKSLSFSRLVCVQRVATRMEKCLCWIFWMIWQISAVWLTSCKCPDDVQHLFYGFRLASRSDLFSHLLTARIRVLTSDAGNLGCLSACLQAALV